jgi:hypothetical protein
MSPKELGGADASALRLVAPPYVDVDRAGLGSRTVLARVESLGREGLVPESLGRAGWSGRSGERGFSDSKLAMLSRPPWYNFDRAAGRVGGGEEGPASDAVGLLVRLRTVGILKYAVLDVDGFDGGAARPIAPLCLGAAVGRRRYRARLFRDSRRLIGSSITYEMKNDVRHSL